MTDAASTSGLPVPRIVSRPRLGATLQMVVHCEQRIASVPFPEPCLIEVVRGEKALAVREAELAAGPGELLFVNAGVVAAMRNRPDGGIYAANCVILSPELVREHSLARGAPPAGPWQPLARPRSPAVGDALRHALAGMSAEPPLGDRLLRHRLLELLIALDDEGLWCRIGAVPDTAERVRALLQGDPAAPWTAAAVAGCLHVSEATLRRALAAEGSSFRALLDEVRMGMALALIQGSTLSLQRIAAECGYASPSRFAGRFRAHFGVLPSVLRG